jgi:hypothetical protein
VGQQPRCRICKKRPPWKGKNCPPGVCKRCYHAHVWPERSGARAGRAPPDEESEPRPMVFDGYHGGFVPVEAASFDVSVTPEAVVHLPVSVLEDQRAAADAAERRRLAADARRARPRCDGRDHRVQTVTRAADGLLALCAACAGGLDVAALTSPALVDALAARSPDPRAQARQRQQLERRLQARRHERDLAAGGIGSCPLCGRFRRLLASVDGAVRVCRACAGNVPIADLDRGGALAALSAGRSDAELARLQRAFPAPGR